MKTKRAIIVINLIEESVEKADEEIEKEILHELTNEMPILPWVESVEKVTVINQRKNASGVRKHIGKTISKRANDPKDPKVYRA